MSRNEAMAIFGSLAAVICLWIGLREGLHGDYTKGTYFVSLAVLNMTIAISQENKNAKN